MENSDSDGVGLTDDLKMVDPFGNSTHVGRNEEADSKPPLI